LETRNSLALSQHQSSNETQWVTLSFRNTKVLHQKSGVNFGVTPGVTPNFGVTPNLNQAHDR